MNLSGPCIASCFVSIFPYVIIMVSCVEAYVAQALSPLTRLSCLKLHLDLIGPDWETLPEAAKVFAQVLSPSLRLIKICGQRAAWHVWNVVERCTQEWDFV